MIMKPEISIITVGMNHLSYVKEMLASLYSVGSPSVSFEVIFVDNCSTDGTVRLYPEQFIPYHKTH